MAMQATINRNAIPDGSRLSDIDLAKKVFADPRRRMLVEMVLEEMDLADQRQSTRVCFEVTVTGRRIYLVPQGKARDALVNDWHG